MKTNLQMRWPSSRLFPWREDRSRLNPRSAALRLALVFCGFGAALDAPAQSSFYRPLTLAPAAAGAEDSGGAAAQAAAEPTDHRALSADEAAKQLANPNNSLASLTFKNQFRWYDGDLPGAEDQFNYTLLFQPVFPFNLGEKADGGHATLFFRPAFPVLVDQPTFNSANSRFEDVSGLGDIAFDVAYGVTEKNGFLWAVGMVGTAPTATDGRLGRGQLSLGPDVLLARMKEKIVYGALMNHQWDVAGWGDQSVSLSLIQPIINYLPGGGWSIGTGGLINYDWVAEKWTVPLNVNVSKTVKLGKVPFRIQLEVNYYVERSDAFGPEWMVGLNLTPVLPNIFDNWIHGR